MFSPPPPLGIATHGSGAQVSASVDHVPAVHVRSTVPENPAAEHESRHVLDEGVAPPEQEEVYMLVPVPPLTMAAQGFGSQVGF